MSLLADVKAVADAAGAPMYREHQVPRNTAPPYSVFRTGASTTAALSGDGRTLGWLTVGQLSLFVVDDGTGWQLEHQLVAALDGLALTGDDGYRRLRVVARDELDDPAGWKHHALTLQARLSA